MSGERCRALVERARFHAVVTALILANAVIVGLETDPDVMATAGGWLWAADRLLVAAFVIA